MSHKPYGPYEKYFKRPLDLCCGLAAVIVFFWLYLILIILGAIFMRGNPFFTQERPGKDDKIFKLIKFRSMDSCKDQDGKLLPDEVRLNKYGRMLRASSLDELPEAFNIIKGDMSVIGPRPLMVEYLPRYNREQHRRHEVRPGLSGYAQVHGRNGVSWQDRFKMDVEYVDHITFLGDLKIILDSVMVAFVKRDGISSETSATMEKFMGNELKQLVIIGASGHGKVVADIAKRMGNDEIRFLDDNKELTECGGYPVVGDCSQYMSFACDIIVAIGNTKIREQMMCDLIQAGKPIPTLIHPSAVIGENVLIGEGTVVVAGAIINPGTAIGRGCIINTGASVDHDCKIEDFVHVSVGAHVAGTVFIGRGTWIGAGAVVSNNVEICSGCMIGAGAVVINDICERGTYVGIPARCEKLHLR